MQFLGAIWIFMYKKIHGNNFILHNSFKFKKKVLSILTIYNYLSFRPKFIECMMGLGVPISHVSPHHFTSILVAKW